MAQRLWLLLSMALVAVLSLGAASCSSDDEEEGDGGGNRGITGTWYGEADEDGGYLALRFGSDGRFQASYTMAGETVTVDEGRYFYDEANSMIELYGEYLYGGFDVWLSGNTLEIEGAVFTRSRPQQGGGDGGGTEGPSHGVSAADLVGTWRYTFGTGFIDIEFARDGYGYWREYDTMDGGWLDPDPFYYSYNADTGIITITMDDETERYEVLSLSGNKLRLRDLNYDDYGEEITFTRR